MTKQYTIKGTGCPEYGKNIIKFFEQLGAMNKYLVGLLVRDSYYCIEDGIIYISNTIPPNHSEIELLPNGMAKGVWYKNKRKSYIKPRKIKDDYWVIGDAIYCAGINNQLIINDSWRNRAVIDTSPLTDLTEIQPYLPDGHEDKEDLLESLINSLRISNMKLKDKQLTESEIQKDFNHEPSQPDKDLVNYLVPEAHKADELDKGIFIDHDKMEIYGFTTIKEAIERLQKLIQ